MTDRFGELVAEAILAQRSAAVVLARREEQITTSLVEGVASVESSELDECTDLTGQHATQQARDADLSCRRTRLAEVARHVSDEAHELIRAAAIDYLAAGTTPTADGIALVFADAHEALALLRAAMLQLGHELVTDAQLVRAASLVLVLLRAEPDHLLPEILELLGRLALQIAQAAPDERRDIAVLQLVEQVSKARRRCVEPLIVACTLSRQRGALDRANATLEAGDLDRALRVVISETGPSSQVPTKDIDAFVATCIRVVEGFRTPNPDPAMIRQHWSPALLALDEAPTWLKSALDPVRHAMSASQHAATVASARSALERSDYEEVHERVRAGLRTTPGDPDLLWILRESHLRPAQVALDEHDFDRSRQHLAGWLDHDPEDETALTLLRETHLQDAKHSLEIGDLDGAWMQLHAWLAHSEDDAEFTHLVCVIHTAKGRAAMESSHLSHAWSYRESILELEPTHREANEWLTILPSMAWCSGIKRVREFKSRVANGRVAWSDDSSRLIVAGQDVVEVWDLSSQGPARLARSFEAANPTLSSQGGLFLEANGMVRSLSDASVVTTLTEHESLGMLLHASFSLAEDLVVIHVRTPILASAWGRRHTTARAATVDEIRVISLTTGAVVDRMPVDPNVWQSYPVLTPDGTSIAYGRLGSVVIRTIASGDELSVSAGLDANSRPRVLRCDRNALLIADYDYDLDTLSQTRKRVKARKYQVWNVGSDSVVSEGEQLVPRDSVGAVSPDGQWIVFCSEYHIIFQSLSSDRGVGIGQYTSRGLNHGCAFSGDLLSLAVLTGDGAIGTWRPEALI